MISIVIPIYNAESILVASVDKLLNYLPYHFSKYEILLCDDGSSDNSRVLMQKVTDGDPAVRCFVNERNFGLGVTLKKLFSEASGETVVYCDCDLPFECAAIKSLCEISSHYGVVVASRYEQEDNEVSFLRKMFSRLYYLWCKKLFNISVKDIGSGTVLFKKDVLDRIDLESKGFGVHVEIFVKASQMNVPIKEIGLSSSRSIKSTFSIWHHGWGIVRETLRFYKSKK